MSFLPQFPLHVNAIALFGLTLLLGVLGGEMTRRSYFLSRITGYIAVGFLVGPSFLNIVTPTLLAGSRIFVEISLGLILFTLGKHLDFTWLRHDKGIIAMSVAESSLIFIATVILLLSFHLSFFVAVLAATIAVATSPAVIMMVTDDLAAKGPVTRRTLILTSLNNLFGLLLFSFFLPMTEGNSFWYAGLHIFYYLSGSILLGSVIFLMTLGLASIIGKRKDNQFILLFAIVIFAIGLAKVLNLSSLLTVFTIGVAARNFNWRNVLIEVDFGLITKLFCILLFVITGLNLQLSSLWQIPWIILTFLLVRTLAKTSGVWMFAKVSRLTPSQAWALSLALTPMSGLAVGMVNMITDFNPALGSQLLAIIIPAVAILNIIGPMATQLAFVKSGEVATAS